MKYKNRLLSGKLAALTQHFSVVVVSGARQVGKSTLLNHQFPKNPERFLSSYVPNCSLVEHIKEGLEKAGLSKLDAH